MFLSVVAAWLMLFILGVSAHFICPYPGCFSFWITLVFSPGHTPDRRNTVFQPNTIPLQDSSPFLSAPTYHPRELPYTLHSEILCLPINPLTAIHICHFHSYNLIFLLSLCGSPFQLFLVCYIQGHATLLFLPSRKNYHRKLSGAPRLSRYSFLACSRSSSVGAVLNFPYRSRITILSSFFSNSRLISVSQSTSSIK